jgi:glycosyltransferase involved in cell wall biosynthesis
MSCQTPGAVGAPRPPDSARAGEVVFLLKGYPRLSETFIAQEIRGLEALGLPIRIVALRHPTDRKTHPITVEIRAPVAYLPEYLYREPGRVLAAWRRARRLAGYGAALRAWLADLRRDPTPNRGRRFGQALVLAAELPPGVARIHAHFLHTPASVARYAALMTGRPWSASAHAKDIWTTPAWEKRGKLAACDWLVTCTEAGASHLAALAPAEDPGAGKVTLLRHGLDLARFPAPTTSRPRRDGADPQDPVVVLSVGRAVEKKGFDDLLAALALLPPDLAWRFVHIGGGPLRPALESQAAALGIASRIEWRGAEAQGEVLAALRRADVFALASRTARDGDRDGLPNVLMEAASQELATAATRAGAIEELIRDGETGLLVPPGNSPALAAAIARLARDPELRARLGAAGRQRLVREFDAAPGLARLAGKFGLAVPGLAPLAAACA